MSFCSCTETFQGRFGIIPAPPILALLLLALYLEAVLAACGHPKRILPRSGWVWFPLLGAVLLFYGVRNFVPGLLPE